MEFAAKLKQNKYFGAVCKIAGFVLAEAAAAVLWYCWRVFYHLDARGVSAGGLLMLLCAAAGGLYLLAVAAAHFVRGFDARAALCIFVCGALMAAANPPMQVSDETAHFLRAYSVSMGRFDFDAARGYPESVDRLMASFPGAWVAAHTSSGVRDDADTKHKDGQPLTPSEQREGVWGPAAGYETFDSSGYALKQYGETGPVTGVADGFVRYLSGVQAQPVTEPLILSLLQYLPAALFMAAARLLGFEALGCFYAGRLANVLVYTLLCWAALKNCRRYKPAFLAVMLMPLSLYMAGSLNYDAILLGCYYFAASYYCRDEITDRSLWGYLAVLCLMNAIKPWINLLWIAVPLLAPGDVWKARRRKWQFAVLGLAGALACTMFVSWYGGAFIRNYGEIGRMLPDVNQMDQLKFVLANPLRYIAVMLGTLYENQLFLGQLGVFGALDLPIELLNLLSPCMLLLGAALSLHSGKALRPLPAAGLGGLAVVYAAGAMTAMYITYTPVGMVRIIGLQARYFLPVFLLLAVLLAGLLSTRLELRESGEKPLRTAFVCFAACGLLGAVLLFQHYFIGPVYVI